MKKHCNDFGILNSSVSCGFVFFISISKYVILKLKVTFFQLPSSASIYSNPIFLYINFFNNNNINILVSP